LRELSVEIQTAAADCYASRGRARVALKDELRHFELERRLAVKRARKDSGLWWGNYNAICENYDTGRRKALKSGGELRERRYTGEGRFTVQIVRGVDSARITDDRLQVSLDLELKEVPLRRGKPLPRLSLTIYQRRKHFSGRKVTWPIVYDRPLPSDAQIQRVQVKRRRVATHWKYTALFVCRVPERAISTAVPTQVCAIKLGFRSMPEGLRVATLVAEDCLQFAVLGREWVDAMDGLDEIARRRSSALNRVHAALRAQWGHRPAVGSRDIEDALLEEIEAQSPRAGSLRELVVRWQKHPDWWRNMYEVLESWRREDKRFLEVLVNKRANLMLSRREQYRRFARSVSQRFGTICIGQLDLAGLSSRKRETAREGGMPKKVHRNRHRASLHSLLAELEHQAEKSGAELKYIRGPLMRMCHSCGSPSPGSANSIYACEACGALCDSDVNAAQNVYAAAATAMPTESGRNTQRLWATAILGRGERLRRTRIRSKPS
jgi:hypothetical protein